MAVKKESKKTESTGRELQPWEKEMAERAKAEQESAASGSGGSKKIGTRGGMFTIDGAEVDSDTIEVIVLDWLFDVTYYQDGFDDDNITPPTAFALGRKEKDLVWHEDSHPDYAGELLKDSPVFQWGSADKGRGKAAKSRRRLLVIDAGDIEDIPAAEVRKLMVPVTSGDEWKSYVNQVAAHGRSTAGVITAITIKKHPKYQFTLSFKMVGLIDGEAMPEIMQKIESVQADLLTPYAKWDSGEQEEATTTRGSKAVAKSAARKRR